MKSEGANIRKLGRLALLGALVALSGCAFLQKPINHRQWEYLSAQDGPQGDVPGGLYAAPALTDSDQKRIEALKSAARDPVGRVPVVFIPDSQTLELYSEYEKGRCLESGQDEKGRLMLQLCLPLEDSEAVLKRTLAEKGDVQSLDDSGQPDGRSLKRGGVTLHLIPYRSVTYVRLEGVSPLELKAFKTQVTLSLHRPGDSKESLPDQTPEILAPERPQAPVPAPSEESPLFEVPQSPPSSVPSGPKGSDNQAP